MATFQVVLTQELASQSVQMSFHYNNLAFGAGNPIAPNAIATAFATDLMPKINAIQSDEIANVSVYCRDLGNPATAVTNAVGGAGAVDSDAAGTIPPDLALLLTFTASDWIDLASNTPYVGTRPGGKGKKYLPGLTEDWMTSAGSVVPAALSTAWDALVAELIAELSVPSLSTTFNHVVFSPPKDALGTLPVRNPLIADVSAVSRKRFTRILSRRP